MKVKIAFLVRVTEGKTCYICVMSENLHMWVKVYVRDRADIVVLMNPANQHKSLCNT